jgi:hypothetical protein
MKGSLRYWQSVVAVVSIVLGLMVPATSLAQVVFPPDESCLERRTRSGRQPGGSGISRYPCQAIRPLISQGSTVASSNHARCSSLQA